MSAQRVSRRSVIRGLVVTAAAGVAGYFVAQNSSVGQAKGSGGYASGAAGYTGTPSSGQSSSGQSSAGQSSGGRLLASVDQIPPQGGWCWPGSRSCSPATEAARCAGSRPSAPTWAARLTRCRTARSCAPVTAVASTPERERSLRAPPLAHFPPYRSPSAARACTRAREGAMRWWRVIPTLLWLAAAAFAVGALVALS
jgi:hypothetical protein